MNNSARIIAKSVDPRKKFNVLTFATHERYQSQLAKTGHNFYFFTYQGCKKWDEVYAKLPSNTYVLPEHIIYKGVDYDFVLCQSHDQYIAASNLANNLKIPLICLTHTLPLNEWSDEQVNQLRSCTGDINVFISEYSKKEWNVQGNTRVIRHGIDTETFKPTDQAREKSILSVVNDFPRRDYCCNYEGWKRVVKPLHDKGYIVDVYGTSNHDIEYGTDCGPARCVEDLVREYNTCSVFLNTSTVSPVPMSLLEAMACGCFVVSTATCMIPEIVTNHVNGFISNDENELSSAVYDALKGENDTKELIDYMRTQARMTIERDFSQARFIDEWNDVFAEAYAIK